MRRDEESERSSVAYGSKGATKKAKKKGKKSGKSKDKDNFLIGFVVAGAAGRKGDQKQLKIDEAEVRRSDAPRTHGADGAHTTTCLLYTSPSPRD